MYSTCFSITLHPGFVFWVSAALMLTVSRKGGYQSQHFIRMPYGKMLHLPIIPGFLGTQRPWDIWVFKYNQMWQSFSWELFTRSTKKAKGGDRDTNLRHVGCSVNPWFSWGEVDCIQVNATIQLVLKSTSILKSTSLSFLTSLTSVTLVYIWHTVYIHQCQSTLRWLCSKENLVHDGYEYTINLPSLSGSTVLL